MDNFLLQSNRILSELEVQNLHKKRIRKAQSTQNIVQENASCNNSIKNKYKLSLSKQRYLSDVHVQSEIRMISFSGYDSKKVLKVAKTETRNPYSIDKSLYNQSHLLRKVYCQTARSNQAFTNKTNIKSTTKTTLRQ